MHWEGSTARDTGAPALTWDQLGEMVDSGLCTVGNHTHEHVRPERLDEEQLDRCSDALVERVGVRPEHFAYTWGVPVPAMEPALRARFRSSATGELGRNVPGDDPAAAAPGARARQRPAGLLRGQAPRRPARRARLRRSRDGRQAGRCACLTCAVPGGRPLRVAHLTTVDMSLSLLLATELRHDVEAGFEVIGLSAPGPYVADVVALGVQHVALPSLTRAWDLRRDVAAARELAVALRRLRLDVLHTHNPKTGVLGRVLGRLAGVPVVVNTCHGLWLAPSDRPAKKAAVLGAEARRSALQPRRAVPERHRPADAVALGRRAPRSARSATASTSTASGPTPLRERGSGHELGVADDELLVGGVGRLVAEKGIREYAATARALAGKARFVWVGPADEDKPDAVRDAQDGVELLGNRADMPDVYAALDVFVLPSYREGFSRSGMEAAATGVASVLSDIRGCREVGVARAVAAAGPAARRRPPSPRPSAGCSWTATCAPARRRRRARALARRSTSAPSRRPASRPTPPSPGAGDWRGRAVRRAVDVAGRRCRRRRSSPRSWRWSRCWCACGWARPRCSCSAAAACTGQEFTIVKFRTMRPPAYDGEPDAGRDTPLGTALRTTSLDELPQLWNVLKGDMSLIGPRPTLPEQVVHYSARQRGRLAVRPGITGWAQVQGRNSLSWPERIELDLDYIARRSWRLDLRIVVADRPAARAAERHLRRRRGQPGLPGSERGAAARTAAAVDA